MIRLHSRGRVRAERPRTRSVLRDAGPGRPATLRWVSVLAISLAMSPASGAEVEDQVSPADATAEPWPTAGAVAEAEPGPVAVVESSSETPPGTDAVPRDEDIPSWEADEADRADESEPPQAEAAEVFVPTEDISEDFAVPFPVDI